MSQAMQAIATWYGGRRFRSRLEARWAVFFDALNIKWDYERYPATGYLSLNYCPDFWLMDAIWIEVKSAPEFYTLTVREKILRLARHTHDPVLALIGDFYGGTMPSVVVTATGFTGFPTETARWEWVEFSCGGLGWTNTFSDKAMSACGCRVGTHTWQSTIESSPRLTAAFDAARGYNFDAPMGPVTVITAGGQTL
jgi:hypothetical protein